MEEIDLCWRLNSRGYRLVCIPESVVYHVGGGTLNAESPYKTYLNFRNNLLLLYKNLPQKSLENILNKRRFFDYLAAFQFFISGKTENAKSVLKARTDFIKMLPDFEEKRKENILYATKTNCNEMLKRSIVIEFFLKRKQTYNQLINKTN
jgi:GT2 family glycosyltransferase